MIETSDNTTLNPFKNDDTSTLVMPVVASDTERAIQEVQAALIIAQRFPRNRRQAMDDILQACMSQELASKATFSYPRGGQEVNGITVDLARALARGWRNIQHGVRELSQSNGESYVEAFAWDTECNTRITKTFQVPHVRHTKHGAKRLTDPRDIYELIANMGARRVRNCILEVIPDDVKEAALKQCDITLKSSADTSPDAIKKMVDVFNKDFKVTKTMLETYIGCRVDAIKPAQVVALRKIYNSIRDGYSKANDWFEIEQEKTTSNVNDKLQEVREKAQGKTA